MTEHPSAAHVEELPNAVAADFGHVYDRNYRRMLGLAFSLTGDRGAAEDLVQEAFLHAHRQWERVQYYDDPMAYVRRVIVTRAVSGWRRRRTERTGLARLRGRRYEPTAAPAEYDAEFWDAVRALPEQQRTVVALRYVDDLSVEQIAAIVERSTGTVKTQLFRARQTLATRLGCSPVGAEGDDDTKEGAGR